MYAHATGIGRSSFVSVHDDTRGWIESAEQARRYRRVDDRRRRDGVEWVGWRVDVSRA